MAKEKRSLVVSILNERETLYYGECTALTVPMKSDTITILPYHTPVIAKLGKGQVVIRVGRQKNVITELEGGLLYVGDNEATVLINL